MSEPVAYINVEERKLEWATPIKWETPTVVKMDKVPLYTKKEWVGLTSEEMFDCLVQVDGETKRLPLGLVWFASALEAKLKEKNT